MKEIKMRALFGILGVAGAGFLLSSVTTSTVGCSSSSSGGSSGSTGTAGSGSTGKGGTTGTAGSGNTTGTGGGGGSGGGGGTGPAAGCTVSDLPMGDPIIADFNTVDAGALVLPIGGTYTYGSGITATPTNGAWHVTATSTSMTGAQYWGAGIYFNGNAAGTDCVDGTAHTGVQFDIMGSVSPTGCTVQYSTNDSAHADSTVGNPPDPKASGAMGSYAPQLDITAMVTGTKVTVMVPFTGTGAPANGNPATGVDKSRLTGVQWQLTTPASTACMLDLTIDNVKFY